MSKNLFDHPELVRLANARKADNLVVVAFANSAYLEVLLNWLVALDRLEIRNYLIVALDPGIYEFLSARKIPTVLSEIDGELKTLWVRRIEIFNLLARNGIDFVHSDVDAVWLKNPIQQYFVPDRHDLIVSQGTIWPPDVVVKRGFVFCCGLFYMRAGEQTSRLLADMMVDVKRTGDDQVTLNRLLDDIEWAIDHSQTYELQWKDHRFICSERTFEGESAQRKLKICVLPHHEFQRLHAPEKEAFVKHLLSPKDSNQKLELLKQTGCHFLHENWRDIQFDADSFTKIMRA